MVQNVHSQDINIFLFSDINVQLDLQFSDFSVLPLNVKILKVIFVCRFVKKFEFWMKIPYDSTYVLKCRIMLSNFSIKCCTKYELSKDYKHFFFRYKCPALQGLSITISQLMRNDREILRKTIENHGGIYSPSLDMESTTLGPSINNVDLFSPMFWLWPLPHVMSLGKLRGTPRSLPFFQSLIPRLI